MAKAEKKKLDKYFGESENSASVMSYCEEKEKRFHGIKKATARVERTSIEGERHIHSLVLNAMAQFSFQSAKLSGNLIFFIPF